MLFVNSWRITVRECSKQKVESRTLKSKDSTMTDLFCSGEELPHPDSFFSYHNKLAGHFTTTLVYNLLPGLLCANNLHQ